MKSASNSIAVWLREKNWEKTKNNRHFFFRRRSSFYAAFFLSPPKQLFLNTFLIRRCTPLLLLRKSLCKSSFFAFSLVSTWRTVKGTKTSGRKKKKILFFHSFSLPRLSFYLVFLIHSVRENLLLEENVIGHHQRKTLTFILLLVLSVRTHITTSTQRKDEKNEHYYFVPVLKRFRPVRDRSCRERQARLWHLAKWILTKDEAFKTASKAASRRGARRRASFTSFPGKEDGRKMEERSFVVLSHSLRSWVVLKKKKRAVFPPPQASTQL